MKPSGGDFCDSIYIGLARDLHPKKLKIVETFHNLSLVHAGFDLDILAQLETVPADRSATAIQARNRTRWNECKLMLLTHCCQGKITEAFYILTALRILSFYMILHDFIVC